MTRIKVGRGDPKLFDQIYVPGKKTNLSEIAEIIPKNSQELIVKPFDPKDVNLTMAALNTCSLQVGASKEGIGSIIVTIPKPT